jgi:hypothetical protein
MIIKVLCEDVEEISTKTTPAHSPKLINTEYRANSKLRQVGKFT